MAEIFRPEKFRKVLTMYLIMWGILWAAAVLVVSFAPPHRVFGKVILYGTTSIGYFANGLFSLGIVTISPIVSVGVIAIGPGACGVIALGGGGACGVYAVGAHAVGVFAIGINAIGIFTLSHSESGRGSYVFSPKRQDARAVKLYTRWFPQFKQAYQPDAEEEK
ncbi:hypothetical protein C6495_00925 [Candidatus Poribacteria bacterium]|nr:MAG: hypothetical protein C6495_00925 [Candidatus Poribacteria bacterium]